MQWRHNGRDVVSNHQPDDCLLSRLFKRRSKKTSKLRVTGLCVGNSPVTGEFPAQRASNAENVSIWWRHHGQIDSDKCRIHRSNTQTTCAMLCFVVFSYSLSLYIWFFHNTKIYVDNMATYVYINIHVAGPIVGPTINHPFSLKYSQQTLHSSYVRARNGGLLWIQAPCVF